MNADESVSTCKDVRMEVGNKRSCQEHNCSESRQRCMRQLVLVHRPVLPVPPRSSPPSVMPSWLPLWPPRYVAPATGQGKL